MTRPGPLEGPSAPSLTGALMISVSGIRGIVGQGFTPELVTRQAAALGVWARRRMGGGAPVVVLGRDSRASGPMFAGAATAGLLSVGCDVIDLGLVPTPTAQLAVEHHRAGAGLVISASHNPIEWNALKLIGPDGAFLDQAAGDEVRALAEVGPPRARWDGLGTRREDGGAVARHLEAIFRLPWVDQHAIRARRFHVALDCVRGAGGTIIPALLQRLGCRVTGMDLEPDGRFPRPPEPTPEHLDGLAELVRRSRADLGMAVDPDVDRLALVDEGGRPIGEDYTLAFATAAVLAGKGTAEGRPERPPPATVVINLSTSLVVEDAARAHGALVVRAPVGEAHVVRVMRETGALIGGEGNGGVILPALHAGRDAPLGVALVLQYLTARGAPISSLVAGAPAYRIVKATTERSGDLDQAYHRLQLRFPEAGADRRDGLRLAWADRWVHIRPSGTEPVVRLIAEAPEEAAARGLIAACRESLANGG